MSTQIFKHYEEDNPFSLSIGDLMASLLLIFVLLLSSTLLRLENVIEEKKVQNEQISELEKAKKKLIEVLKHELRSFDVEVDPQTGVIRIREAILFQFGRWDLKWEGRRFLDDFVPIYTQVLFSDPQIAKHISQIIIEGHTDNVGSYDSNLLLSLQRAASVSNFIFSAEIKYFGYKDNLRQILSVNGRSYIEPIVNNNTEENRSRNRRVEFKFRLRDWDMVEIDY